MRSSQPTSAKEVRSPTSPPAADRESFSAPAAPRSSRSTKRGKEVAMTSRPEEGKTKTEPDPAEPEEGDEVAKGTEPVTAPIDEDVAGSVNAAVHEADE